MTPTNELRFVERLIDYCNPDGTMKYQQKVRILQQKWALPMHTNASLGPQFVWRDVPCVKEEVVNDSAKIRAAFEGDFEAVPV